MLCRLHFFLLTEERELYPTVFLSAVLCLYSGLVGGFAKLFRVSLSFFGCRNNFTKILQFAVTHQPPIALVLPGHLCHFSDRHQRQQHLLTYPLS
ncbi:hypothetical protein QUB63_12895 [Microcoleus sp. ARI1-B5]|uniref:hypothetical protein n=1 Tax=unclassified Microcoleus TaxID=2642155 RepID=UPI002FD6D4E0